MATVLILERQGSKLLQLMESDPRNRGWQVYVSTPTEANKKEPQGDQSFLAKINILINESLPPNHHLILNARQRKIPVLHHCENKIQELTNDYYLLNHPYLNQHASNIGMHPEQKYYLPAPLKHRSSAWKQQQNTAFRKHIGFGSEPLILHQGHEHKKTLLKALKLQYAINPQLAQKMRIIFLGDSQEQIVNLTQKLGLHQQVFYLRQDSKPFFEQLLCACDIVVNTETECNPYFSQIPNYSIPICTTDSILGEIVPPELGFQDYPDLSRCLSAAIKEPKYFKKLATTKSYSRRLSLGQIMKKIIKSHPQQPDFIIKKPNSPEHLKIGKTYLEQGQYDKAEASLKLALQAAPDDYQVLYYLGVLSWRYHSNDEALQFLKKSLGRRPEYQPAILAIAMIYQRLEIFEEAISWLQKSINISGSQERHSLQAMAQLCCKHPQPQKAQQILENLIQDSGQVPCLMRALAHIYQKTGRSLEAADICQRFF